MALLQNTFNAAQLPKENTIDLLPVGAYIASISKTKLKDTSNGSGKIIQLCFIILEGEQKGKCFFDNINIINQNPIAVEIGLARLNTYLSIGNIPLLKDTDQLLNIVVLATLGQREYKGNAVNNVNKIEAVKQMHAIPNATPNPVVASTASTAPTAETDDWESDLDDVIPF